MLIIIIAILLVISLVVGFSGFLEMDFVIEIKRLSNAYYSLGLSFNDVPSPNENIEVQELVIGLFFVNFVFIFYKEKISA